MSTHHIKTINKALVTSYRALLTSEKWLKSRSKKSENVTFEGEFDRKIMFTLKAYLSCASASAHAQTS